MHDEGAPATLAPMAAIGSAISHEDELVLTQSGYKALVEELRRLKEEKQPAAVEELHRAADVAGDLSDNSEYLHARSELDRLEQRIDVLETRVRAARRLRPREGSSGVASRGSHVVVEDLDDATVSEYVLVASAESDPEHGRLSDESPVGRALTGHAAGEVVKARTPRRTRHLRIAQVDRRRR
jgi:transcription elongation factor GreA